MNARFFGTLPLIVIVQALLSCRALAADVDVAIVFAVDVSGSINATTADLQRKGHASALRSPETIAAIASNERGCIAISYFEWSSPGQRRIVLPWRRICGIQDAQAAASIIEETGDRGYGRAGRGGTSISYAISLARLLLDQYVGTATRKVIDISSNGRNNDGLPVEATRLMALAKGYTINAIAVPPEHRGVPYSLAGYFAEEVIGGPSAFVIAPKTSDDYATALRRKLAIEIAVNDASPTPRAAKTGSGSYGGVTLAAQAAGVDAITTAD